MTWTGRLARILARYSEGFRLATEFGQSSGPVFEYICDNEPRGDGFAGRWIDQRFLLLPGAQRIRQRVRTTKEILRELLHERRQRELPTTILDVASGTGRALRELCREDGSSDLNVVCHDRDPRKVMHGRELAAEENLANVTFAVGDATDPASFLVVHEPDIILACGLFPVLERDDAVRTVLRLAYDHLADDGLLVCTTTKAGRPLATRWGPAHLDQFLDRDPAIVAGWMRAAGFTDPAHRVCAIGDNFLVARKPRPN